MAKAMTDDDVYRMPDDYKQRCVTTDANCDGGQSRRRIVYGRRRIPGSFTKKCPFS